jgi:hypothetical protein
MKFIIEKDGKQFIDVVKVLPNLEGKITVINYLDSDRIEVYLKPKIPGRGHDSKKVILKRFIELDDLFFEGLGLWQGEGGKDKGLYFGNNCEEILLHFLKFVEQKLGISRNEFKVTVNVPALTDSEEEINKKWSKKLQIPFENFTHVCVDNRINEEYAQFYINGIILSELMKSLNEKLKHIILRNREFATAYLRGIIAGEGSVHLKKSGVISHIAISSVDKGIIDFCKKCLSKLGITFGKYQNKRSAFPIYGKRVIKLLRIYNYAIFILIK